MGINRSHGHPKVAVLGGTGWLGRHLCATFSQHGYEVVALARRPHPGGSDHAFVPLDLNTASAASIAALLRSLAADVVVNSTDSTNATDGWHRSEQEHFRFNADVVERLVSAVGSLPGRVRLIQLGTIHEYGPVGAGIAVDESVTPRPVSAYARAKLAGSSAVLRAARAGTVDAVVLRLVSLCGPNPSAESFPGVLLRLLQEAVSSGGDLVLRIAEASRDFLDVRDAADAVLRAARAAASGRVINIGSGTAVAISDLVTLFVTAAGHSPAMIRRQDEPVDSFGGDWTQADIRLARELLGWQPQVSLPESLRAMWESAGAPSPLTRVNDGRVIEQP